MHISNYTAVAHQALAFQSLYQIVRSQQVARTGSVMLDSEGLSINWHLAYASVRSWLLILTTVGQQVLRIACIRDRCTHSVGVSPLRSLVNVDQQIVVGWQVADLRIFIQLLSNV